MGTNPFTHDAAFDVDVDGLFLVAALTGITERLADVYMAGARAELAEIEEVRALGADLATARRHLDQVRSLMDEPPGRRDARDD